MTVLRHSNDNENVIARRNDEAISTDDLNGEIIAYVGEGELTNDPLTTFGGYGVVKIPNLQDLLQFICENGFEHHTAVNLSQTAAAVDEALDKYLGWDVYYHS